MKWGTFRESDVPLCFARSIQHAAGWGAPATSGPPPSAPPQCARCTRRPACRATAPRPLPAHTPRPRPPRPPAPPPPTSPPTCDASLPLPPRPQRACATASPRRRRARPMRDSAKCSSSGSVSEVHRSAAAHGGAGVAAELEAHPAASHACDCAPLGRVSAATARSRRLRWCSTPQACGPPPAAPLRGAARLQQSRRGSAAVLRPPPTSAARSRLTAGSSAP